MQLSRGCHAVTRSLGRSCDMAAPLYERQSSRNVAGRPSFSRRALTEAAPLAAGGVAVINTGEMPPVERRPRLGRV